MVFSSPVFLFVFLTAVYIIYRIVPSMTAKNGVLLIFSLLFYTYGEPKAVLIMLLSIAMNYGFGLMMKKENRHRKTALALAVISNLLILGIFKYAGFGAEMLNRLPFLSVSVPHIALPVGISFYTFQAMSYVIDSYKEPSYIQKDPFRTALYITFFPQLIAGPIVKYSDFARQADERIFPPKQTAEGIKRFITGLSKKLLIANTMASVADRIYSFDTSELSTSLAWLGAISYLFQIYFDFSGYSDMATGLGRMFGFEFRENFDYPYISQSMQDFWRRWHISVSAWFKEYLYIPLGGNRKGSLRTAFNKLTVFFCTGLWHGASLNFIVWGLINGGFMMLESYRILNTEKWLRPLRHIYALLVTVTAFVFFRADDLPAACRFIGHMFIPAGGEVQTAIFIRFLDPLYILTLVAAIIFSVPTVAMIRKKFDSKAYEAVSYAVSMVLFALCVLSLSSASYDPFIYFRF